MKFYIHKLGCPKNDVDADYISARLIADGHEPVKDPNEAESIVVNTCGFILPAKEESISELFTLSGLKKTGKLKKIIATGCLSQRYGTEMSKEIPELDGIFGLGQLDDIAASMKPDGVKSTDVIRTPAEHLDYIAGEKRYVSGDQSYAYLKISDGCDRTCTFCAIPGMRGKYRSRTIEAVLKEAKFLVEAGKREIILVSQESTLFGAENRSGETLLKLLEALDQIEGLEWIRLLYLYPTQVSRELVQYMVDPSNKTLNYFDIPLQHISSTVLKRMKRHMTREKIEDCLEMIRSLGGQTIRTGFIVGFPGETEAEFEELAQFTRDFAFDRMGVFAYSAEEGTPAATLPGQIAEDVKNHRLDLLMTRQREVVEQLNNSLIGTTVPVIIDSIDEATDQNGQRIGRTIADAPDIDQEIIVEGGSPAIGAIVKVRVDRCEGYDLHGTIVEQ